MLGFLRGIEKGVEREGAAQRAHYGTQLGMKESHLDRLLNQIKYNQQQKRLRDRDARQDFVSDRAYDRSVLESDRNYQFRQGAEARAGKIFDFNYGEDGYMRQRAQREGEIHDFNYGEGGYMHEQRKRAGEIHDFNYGPEGYMRQRADREGEIHDFNYGPEGYMPKRAQREEDIHRFNYDPETGMQVLRRDLFQKVLSACHCLC